MYGDDDASLSHLCSQTLTFFTYLWYLCMFDADNNDTKTESAGFFLLIGLSCMSAFTLNLSTYLCTLYNSPLTTSVVARAKTILQVRTLRTHAHVCL